MNIANDLKGIQLSGLIGVGNNITGSQISCVNFVNDIKGLQFSGFLNVTNTLKGFQMGGLANIVNNLEGVQLTGIFNRVNVLKGFQFGILNITDTISCGIPMGLVSIVKKEATNSGALFV